MFSYFCVKLTVNAIRQGYILSILFKAETRTVLGKFIYSFTNTYLKHLLVPGTDLGPWGWIREQKFPSLMEFT